MLHTLLDIALSPIERFTYELENSILPISLAIVGIIVFSVVTFFFIKRKHNKNKENKED